MDAAEYYRGINEAQLRAETVRFLSLARWMREVPKACARCAARLAFATIDREMGFEEHATAPDVCEDYEQCRARVVAHWPSRPQRDEVYIGFQQGRCPSCNAAAFIVLLSRCPGGRVESTRVDCLACMPHGGAKEEA